MIYAQVDQEYLERLEKEIMDCHIRDEYHIEWVKYLKNRTLFERLFNIDRFPPLSVHPKYKDRLWQQ